MDWGKYYMDQAGGSYNYDYFVGNKYQKGYGLGGTFKRFFKWIVPIFKRHALPVVHTGLKTVGREVLSSAANIANDVVLGKNLKESANKNITQSINNLKETFEKKLEGQGYKKKTVRKFRPNSSIKGNTNRQKYVILKKQKKEKNLDIFD
jgi:hypothetical protein